MNWKNRKVFVTGADGFIGSHLTEVLIDRSADVTALACYNSFDHHGWLDDLPRETNKSIRLVRGDVRDSHQMMELCRGQEVVFHLAALIAIPYSYDAPSSYVQTNVQGTVNVLKACQEAGVSQIIHTSTSEVYGTAQFTPITEDHPLRGQSPYSASKIAADMMAEAFHRSFGLPVITVRPFNTYGPRQSERAVISTVIRQAIDPACTEIRVGNTAPKRDFIFVSDTVNAFLAAASLDKTHFGSVFNAGSGHNVGIGEIIEMIQKVCDCDKPVVSEAARHRPDDSEVMVLMADATRLHEACGWSPAVSLEEGLEKTVVWWRDNNPKGRTSAFYAV
jgi:UDP-glucose 4-epimerase